MRKIDLDAARGRISAPWTPLLLAELNGQHVKVARLEGRFVAHRHESADEMFLVLDGRLALHLPDETVTLEKGELFVVPRGVEHLPEALPSADVLLFEPVGTRNTGEVEDERTVDPEWI